MTFLEAATLLIPALTGIAITVDDGNSKNLKDFEQQYCFSPQLQPVYTAAGLSSFFESHSDSTIYEVLEPMGSWSIAFQVQKHWVLIGPYVEDDWNERSARFLLAKLGASEAMYAPFKSYWCKLPAVRREYILQAAMLMIQQERGLSKQPIVKTIHAKAEQFHSAPTFLGAYEEVQIIQRRYANEDRFILAVSQGDTETAIRLMKELIEASAGLRFISDNMQDQIGVAAIMRTLIRMGAKQAGLSPVLIDSISQEYAQRMQRTTTMRELKNLFIKMAETICSQVRTLRENHRSRPVRRAVEYMTANLSDPMSIVDIARVAGVERHKLTRDFQREMGMTIKQYLKQTRCSLAADLLVDSEASIQEIATYIGYPDSNYFTKVFKDCHGMTPQEWRMIHKRPAFLKKKDKK